MARTEAATRLRAFTYGDEAPASWTRGDLDVTFTPFCQVVRSVFKSVEAIRANREQTAIVVYVPSVDAKTLASADQKLKAARIPGNPRFKSIVLGVNYKGMLAVKFNIYSGT